MRCVKYELDDSLLDAETYEKNPEKYQGLIRCAECNKKAWYTKSFTYKETTRAACFNAHHIDGCQQATSILIAEDMESEENEDDVVKNNADILVDLDKTKHNSIEVSSPADKHIEEDHNWNPSPRPQPSGSKHSDFSDSRSLRQILSYLVKNPEYGVDKRIKITADNGRVILNGILQDYLVEIPTIGDDEFQKEKIFWGEINNYTEKPDGSLWLNYGSYNEPSLFLSKELKDNIMKVYRLNSLERFKGTHFIVVGWAGISQKGKVILRTAQPKYANFINYRNRPVD